MNEAPCRILNGRDRVVITGRERAKVEAVSARDGAPLAGPDLHGYFDAVYVITLARRADRREAFEKQLANWPFIPPEYRAAVDAKAAVLAGNSPVACMLSHLQCLQQAMIDGHRRILILEDDCELTDDFPDVVARFLAAVPDDWECLMLGGQLYEESQSADCGRGVRGVSHVEMLHCYALQGDAIRSLADYWGQTHVHCDHRIAEWQDAGHKTYAPERWIAGQSAGVSDLMRAEMPKRLFDERTPLLRKLVATPLNTAVVTVACYLADEVDAKVERLQRSCDFYNVPLTLYGVGESYGTHYAGKVLRLLRWLKGLPPHVSHLMFLDARDTLLNGGMHEICAALNAAGDRVLMGTESTCSPDPRLAPGYVPSLQRRTYLNSGVYGGPVARVREMLQAMIAAHDANPMDPHRDNDQQLAHLARHAGTPIALDVDGTLAANLYGMDLQPPPNAQFMLRNGRVAWRDNGVMPCVVHWNGLGTETLPAWWSAMSS